MRSSLLLLLLAGLLRADRLEDLAQADSHFRKFCLEPIINATRSYQPAYPASPALGLCRLEDFKIDRTVGHGNFGKAQLAEHLPTGQLVVMKNIYQSQHRPAVFQLVRNEECTLHVASQYCPFVVKHHCTLLDGVDVVLVMEWVQGQSLDHILRLSRTNGHRRHRRRTRKDPAVTISETDFRNILAHLVVTLERLHELRIMFYDLRLKNVMLRAEDKQIRLIDFGLASFHYPSPLPKVFRTPDPPNFSQGHVRHMDDFKEPDRPIIDDWYDLGLLMHEAYSGVTGGPFYRMISEYKFYLKYQKGIECPLGMGKDECDLMQALCDPRVEKRLGLIPGSPELFRSHPCLRDAEWPPQI